MRSSWAPLSPPGFNLGHRFPLLLYFQLCNCSLLFFFFFIFGPIGSLFFWKCNLESGTRIPKLVPDWSERGPETFFIRVHQGDDHPITDCRRNAADSTRPTFGDKRKSAMVDHEKSLIRKMYEAKDKVLTVWSA